MNAATHDTIPAPAPELATYYRLEVRAREWAGALRDGWRPAIAGSLNQTRDDDDAASLFATIPEAMACLDRVVMPAHPDAARLVRATDGAVLFVFERQGESARVVLPARQP